MTKAKITMITAFLDYTKKDIGKAELSNRYLGNLPIEEYDLLFEKLGYVKVSEQVESEKPYYFYFTYNHQIKPNILLAGSLYHGNYTLTKRLTS